MSRKLPVRYATCSTALTMAPKKGSDTSATISPRVSVDCCASARALALGWYCSSSMAPSTAWREVILALGELLITRETVATDTPANLATSFMVAISLLSSLRVIGYIDKFYGNADSMQGAGAQV